MDAEFFKTLGVLFGGVTNTGVLVWVVKTCLRLDKGVAVMATHIEHMRETLSRHEKVKNHAD